VIALVPVREGVLPAGAVDCVAEAGGRVLVVGSGATEAAAALGAYAVHLATTDAPFGQLVTALARRLADEDVIVLPTSPDGRDLAPALAYALGWPLVAGALTAGPGRATCTSWGGRVVTDVVPSGPFVVTLQPSGAPPPAPVEAAALEIEHVELLPDDAPVAECVALLPPDVLSMDLAESPRIVAGGAGLDGASQFELLGTVATALGAAIGGTRVVTDRGWLGHERQIGTTGVSVRPELYVALGISGAVQHTAGLGDPAHVISVNTDPHCPMMQLADLAIVADANATLRALAERLGVEP
jgi:electron transfer flavoprotein alpha subunit